MATDLSADGLIESTLEATVEINAPKFLADPNWAMLAIFTMSVWQGFGYNMLILSAALDFVPENLIEAAELDGANAWPLLWRIKFPLITPSAFFATMMTLITSFQGFIQPFILIKGGRWPNALLAASNAARMASLIPARGSARRSRRRWS